MNSVRDIASGMEPRTAVKRRLADVSDEMLDDVKRKIRRKMTGGGDGKRRKKKIEKVCKKRNGITKKKKESGKICRRKIKDIFSM